MTDKSKKQISSKTFLCKIALVVLMGFSLVSCGDSWSDYTFIIDNKTGYNINLHSTGIELENNICPHNKETVVFIDCPRTPKKLYCTCPPLILKEQIEFVIDDGKKHLTKDFWDSNNWECTGDKGSSLIMVGKYYYNINFDIVIDDFLNSLIEETISYPTVKRDDVLKEILNMSIPVRES